MIHLGVMPGTPFYKPDSYEALLEAAVTDAVLLDEGGATGCLVQTVDRVYSVEDEADPARIAAVATIVREINRATRDDFKVGVQIMRNAVKASLGVAKVSGGDFVRVGTLVGATITAHGIVEANPLDVQTYRTYIQAHDIALIAEIHSMHFHWMGGKPLAQIAWDAKYVGADAVAVGAPDDDENIRMVTEIKNAHPDLPVILSGYTDHANAARLLAVADGAYVGSCLEKDGWGGRIDKMQVQRYAEIVAKL